MSKSKARREYDQRRALGKIVEASIPCEDHDCHYYEEAAMRDPEDNCENLKCPWRPFLMAWLKHLQEKK